MICVVIMLEVKECAACMRKMGNAYNILIVKSEKQDIDRMILLKWILKQYGMMCGMNWIQVAQDRVH